MANVDFYVCPTCKELNTEHEKYCHKCGTWLINAKKASKSSQSKRKGWIVAIIVFGLILYFALNNPQSTLTMGDVNLDQIAVKQLKINPIKPSATADITAMKDIKNPFEISLVFYDESGDRVGRASTLMTQALSSNSTTTVDFRFTEVINLQKAKNVRVEYRELSPMELLQKVTEYMK